MNVVIYARYSSHNQTEQSIEGQLNVCKEYAKRNNYNVIGEYIDRAKSGTKDDREQFQKMIKESEKKQFNGILVYQLDRFARDRYDSAVYKRKLKKNNVRVLSARENISEDASGVLMESVLEGMAEYFSLELGQKVKRGMKINADNCYYNGGTVPLGFKLLEVKKDAGDNNKPILKKKYAIDEENAYIIKTVFKMYINGSTMADIIRYLNNQNQLTVAKKPFNKNSIRKILLNKKYIGTYSYGGKETHNGIPRIIDDEMFCKAQDIMLKNKKAPARARAKTEYLLTTKLFCGYCKEMMTGISGTSQTKKLHNYYSCKSSRLKLCDKKTVQKDYIESIVVNKARELLTDENIVNIANEVVARVELEKEASTLKRLNKFLKENEKQKTNLFDSLKVCDNDNNRKIIFEGMTKLEIEHTQLENEILLEESNFVKITVPQVRYFLLQIRKGNIDDIRYRKILINVLINKIYLYDDKIIGIFNTQDKEFEDRLPSIKDIESSLMGDNALPIIM